MKVAKSRRHSGLEGQEEIVRVQLSTSRTREFNLIGKPKVGNHVSRDREINGKLKSLDEMTRSES